jgi:hypothetical protein
MVTLIKEILSEDKRFKTSIYQRSDGLFEVETCRWTQDTDPETGSKSDYFWEPSGGRFKHICDNLPFAERAAKEELRMWSGDPDVSEEAWIEAEVVFLTEREGGRKASMPQLSGNSYRPHLVIGDPTQRQAKLLGNYSFEEMLGIAFTSAPNNVQPGESFTATIQLAFYPYAGYDALVPGTTFTIREVPKIVAYGRVLTGPWRISRESESDC